MAAKCEAERATLERLRGERVELIAEFKKTASPTPDERADFEAQKRKLGAAIDTAQRALDVCLALPPPTPLDPRPPGLAPRDILDYRVDNPRPDIDLNSPTWTSELVGTDKRFPLGADREWVNVYDRGSDYDATAAGVCGYIINPATASTDFPFLHPMGRDWEFAVAVDRPDANHPQTSDFESLLAPGNVSYDHDIDTAVSMGITDLPANGLFAVEADGNNVPLDFQRFAHSSDRVAAYGRWIVDTGHSDRGGFHTEIHPPLLMACAGIRRDSGGEFTRLLLTSRPYLVGQTFAAPHLTGYDEESFSQDGEDDGGTFLGRLADEVAKVSSPPIPFPLSTLVEAHPKIKSRPFDGSHQMRLVVRPPDTGLDTSPRRLEIRSHFDTRAGVDVNVEVGDDSATLQITLDASTYRSPAMPRRRDNDVSLDALRAEDPGAAGKITLAELLIPALEAHLNGVLSAVVVAGVLSRGVRTDEYDAVDGWRIYNPAHSQHATGRPSPAGPSPYPVLGWIEARWVRKKVISPTVQTTGVPRTTRLPSAPQPGV